LNDFICIYSLQCRPEKASDILNGTDGIRRSPIDDGRTVMISRRNIVCFANDWKSDPTSKHQIMKLLAHENKILWLNSVGMRKPNIKTQDLNRMGTKLTSFFRGIKKINSNFFVFSPIVIPFHDKKIFKYINSLLIKKCLENYIKKLDFTNPIFWTYMPNVEYIISKMNPDFLVYHCVDNWSKFSFIDSKIIEDEKALCEVSDLVIVSSKNLYDSKSPYNNNTHYVSHGVDYNYFNSANQKDYPVPEEMKKIPNPIAGFFGLIHEWLDFELISSLAENNPNIQFVFIGKRSIDVRKLEQYDNIHFIDQKPYEELIKYASHFDVGIIPFKINELTLNVNPLKMKEYLAAGMPVVSVNLPEVAKYKNVVRIADDYKEFEEALKNELSDNNIASFEERIIVAKNETWAKKVDEISELIAITEANKNRKK